MGEQTPEMKTRVVISVEQQGRTLRRFGIGGARLRALVVLAVLLVTIPTLESLFAAGQRPLCDE